MEETRQKQS